MGGSLGSLLLYVKDRWTGRLQRPPLNSGLGHHRAELSDDGRFLAFATNDCSLAGPRGTCSLNTIYIHQLESTPRFWKVTQSQDLGPIIDPQRPYLRFSANADYLGFLSAIELIPPDADDDFDGYLYSFCRGRE